MNLENLTTLEIIYWASTIFGGSLFLLRTILLFAGGEVFSADMDFDGDIDIGDIDTDFDGDVHPDTDISFKFLSLQGITAFFMMFGLVGLTLYNIPVHPLLSVLGATMAGVFTTWVIGILFVAMGKLQSDGTIKIADAVGQTGEVYLTIPKNGSGQVRVIVQETLKIYDAVSEVNKKISTGTSVEVIRIKGNTLVVK